MPPATETSYKAIKIEIHGSTTKQLQSGKQKHSSAQQEQSGVLVGAKPVCQSLTERFRKKQNCQCPRTRRGAGDDQKAGQRHAQESGGKISWQPCAWHDTAENQNGSAAFGKPAFAVGNFCGEAVE